MKHLITKFQMLLTAYSTSDTGGLFNAGQISATQGAIKAIEEYMKEDVFICIPPELAEHVVHVLKDVDYDTSFGVIDSINSELERIKHARRINSSKGLTTE